MWTRSWATHAGRSFLVASLAAVLLVACSGRGETASFCTTVRDSGQAFARFPGPDRTPAGVRASAGGVVQTADQLAKSAPPDVAESAKAVAAYLHSFVAIAERHGFDLNAVSARATVEERRIVSTPPTDDAHHLFDVAKVQCGVDLAAG